MDDHREAVQNLATTTSQAAVDAPLLLREPEPIWPGAPRLCAEIEFPPYRYVRKLNPHPWQDDEGHAFATRPKTEALQVDAWQSHVGYRYGIDLYHEGYLWEAQTAWEAIWRKCDSDSKEANLLQGLILNAAAQYKTHVGEMISANTRSRAARWRLARIRQASYDGAEDRFLGLDISDLIEQMKAHYGSRWKDPLQTIPIGSAPRLRLEE